MDVPSLLDNCQLLLSEMDITKQLKEIHGTLTVAKNHLELVGKQQAFHFYKPKHLTLKEVFPKEMLNISGFTEIELWSLMNPKILWTADAIRDLYGEGIYVNTKEHQYRGFRPKDCTVGADFSQHRLANGLDFNLIRTPAPKVREDILNNPNQKEFQYITCLEMNVSWVHMDCRNWDKEARGILKVYP